MKKLLTIFVLLSLLVGCSKSDTTDEERYLQYKAVYTDLLNTDRFLKSSSYYTVEAVLIKLETPTDGNNYRYDVTIDNPQIAMYNIAMLVIVNNQLFDENNIMPSHGIIHNFETNFIPNQINLQSGYLKGLTLSGYTNNPSISLRMTFSWYDQSKLNQVRENFEFTIEYKEEVAP